MTAAGVRTGSSGTHGAARLPGVGAACRLTRLYAVSRRVPAAIGLAVAFGALLWASLHWHWSIVGGPAAQQFVPLTIETGAAAVVAVASYGPFGDPERATGCPLASLRLGGALLLTVSAFAMLSAGAAGGTLPGGSLALLRNVAGITGIGLLSAVVAGGAFAWTGPVAYLLVTEVVLTGNPAIPLIWAGRPPQDAGAAAGAALVFAAGLGAFTVRGARDGGSARG